MELNVGGGNARSFVAGDLAQPRQRLLRVGLRAGAGSGNQHHQPTAHNQIIRLLLRGFQAIIPG